ncbi:MAG: transporter substrate-binding domain-containing protein, partial [Lachnospiraceae bacterium]|nr:transporter substrate-binding domain-containing protein [Lachnospiraceae bacterium]
MKKLLSIILSITMLLSMGTVAFAEETTTSGAREVEGIIKVGVNAEFPPFEYMENDKMLGFDIDLMNYIATRIGYGVEFVNMPFDKLIPAVISGEVDCAISAISQTNERREVVDFSRPYLRATITENNGETSTKSTEYYSIVFKEGMSDTLLKSSFPTEEEKKYLLITGALDELISDGTVDKLIEKYNLNKALEEDTEIHYEYDTVKGSQTPAAKTATEIPKSEEITMTTGPAPSEWAAKDIDYAVAVGI